MSFIELIPACKIPEILEKHKLHESKKMEAKKVKKIKDVEQDNLDYINSKIIELAKNEKREVKIHRKLSKDMKYKLRDKGYTIEKRLTDMKKVCQSCIGKKGVITVILRVD